MNEILPRYDETAFTLPEPVKKTPKARRRETEIPLIHISPNATWVVHSEYEFDTVPVEYTASLDGSTEPERREMLRIKPKRGAKSKPYTLDGDIMDECVRIICNEFKLPVKEMERFQKRAEKTGESTLGLYDIVEDHFRDKILAFAKEYGLPGAKFAEAGLIYRKRNGGRIMVKDNSGRHLGTLEEWLGNNLTSPIPEEVIESGNLAGVFDHYGELLIEIVNDFQRFFEWVSAFTRLKPSHYEDSISDYFLESATKVLRASNAGFEWEGNRLVVVHRASSLLHAAYLRVIDRKLRGKSFCVCGRYDCSKVFIPWARHQTFCNPACANITKVRRFRKKRREQEANEEV